MGKEQHVLVGGKNVAEPDSFTEASFVYRGIGRGDKNGHGIK
jgi:UDP-N-acetyl-D-mannosaminuronic acid dehydrogenase